MAPPTLVPDKNTLIRLRDQGMTHEAIADWVYETTGQRVTRTAISAAFQRHGLSKEGHRYKEAIPWRVKVLHAKAYPVRMLRLMGRQADGQPLNDVEQSALERWLESMEENNTIVGYDSDSDLGFYYIDRKYKDNKSPYPVRRKEINVSE